MHLWSGRFIDNASFQIDDTVTKWPDVFVSFLYKTQPYVRCFLVDPSNETWSEVFCETIAGAQRERSFKLFEVEFFCRTQNRLRVANKLTDRFSKFKRPGRRYKSASCPDQQGVTSSLTQSCQSSAHGRGA